MEKQDILKYENREQLFRFLIDDFGLNKVEEKYDSEYFGNFYIILSTNEFSLRYVNDRSFINIEISSNADSLKWYALSFIKDLIYNKDRINTDERVLDNFTRIEELNSFLKKDFSQISELFNMQNYPNTKERLDEGLNRQFKLRFP